MSQSPNPAAPQQVAPLLALATEFLRSGRPREAIAPLRDAAPQSELAAPLMARGLHAGVIGDAQLPRDVFSKRIVVPVAIQAAVVGD